MPNHWWSSARLPRETVGATELWSANLIGRTLVHYEVLEKIGHGGMGEVYRARDVKLGREVALKILPADFAADEGRRERFRNEARTLATLNHPNIVTIYAVEEADGLHFLSMELVQGQPLSDEIPPDGFPEDRCLEIAIPLTEAIAAAHEIGVVHRDLKPSNLMINRDGRVKILDFGLATVAHAPGGATDIAASLAATRDHTTVEGMLVGTIPYMSPEQIEGGPVDGRSDIFSLGIILYEMITGRSPFHGDSGLAIMSSILRDAPAPVTHLKPSAAGELGRLVGRCLEKDPKRRYQSARDIHNDLLYIQQDRLLERSTEGSLGAAPVPASAAEAEGGIGFQNDIYISYAQLDNEAQLAGQQGWVSAFHRSLEVRVGQLLGKKPNIFRDPRRDDGSGNSGPASQSALLISVLSPRYVKSEICTAELRGFLAATTRTGGPKWGARYRVFKVVKTPTPVDRHPPEIQPIPGYEFYKMDPDTGRARELDQIFGPEAQRDYWARLDDLAHDIVELLERVEEGEDSGEIVHDSSVGASAAKGVVYLASTSYDLKSENEALRRDLSRHGYLVLPASPLPLVEPEFSTRVRDELGRARLSIHMVGRNYGVIPEGAAMSVIELQNQLAEERALAGGLNQILWISPESRANDERQEQFLNRLHDNPRLIRGSDILETSLEDLKTVVHQILDPPKRHETRVAAGARDDDSVTRVYLICDQRDQDCAGPLADFLFEQGFEVTLPIFEGDEAEVREDHEDNLRLADAVLVYYGAGNELWLRRKLREVQKSSGLGRTKALRAKAIWVAAPITSQKQRLRTREAMVLSGTGAFSPQILEPFVSAVSGSA